MTEVDAMVFTIRSIRRLLLHGSKETVAESSFIVNSNNGFAHSKVNAHPKLVPSGISQNRRQPYAVMTTWGIGKEGRGEGASQAFGTDPPPVNTYKFMALLSRPDHRAGFAACRSRHG